MNLLLGDCRAVLASLPPEWVDAVVTDPPYNLGFMGKDWDKGGVANDPALWAEVLRVMKPGSHLVAFGSPKTYHRMACAVEDAGFEVRDQLQWIYGGGMPKTHSTLKPASQPVVLARKPLSEKSVAHNMLRWGVGGLNIRHCRVGDSPDGRWPANVVHDGSDEVSGAFPDAPGQLARASDDPNRRASQNCYGAMVHGSGRGNPRGDIGSAARFFYCARASKSERGEGNNHPTLKPITLMRWLCRLVAPPAGVVLDPFMGSGSTGLAAREEGMDFVGIEMEAEYLEIAKKRLGAGEAANGGA